MKEKIMSDLRRWTKKYAVSRDARESYLMQKMPHTTQSKVFQAFEEFKQLIPRELTPFQKLSLLYRCIASEATYDTTKKVLSRSFLGALRDRNAMCGGFADLVTLLFGYVLEVPVYTVLGYTEPNPDKIDPDGTTHAWNIVCLPEGTFHLDLTWDLWKGQENKPAQYFLISDKKINRTWCRDCYPPAPRSYTGKMYEDDAVQKQLRTYYRELQQRFQEGVSRLPETALLKAPKPVVEPSAFVTRLQQTTAQSAAAKQHGYEKALHDEIRRVLESVRDNCLRDAQKGANESSLTVLVESDRVFTRYCVDRRAASRVSVKSVYTDFGQRIRKEVEVALQAEGYPGCTVKEYFEGSHLSGDRYASFRVCLRW